MKFGSFVAIQPTPCVCEYGIQPSEEKPLMVQCGQQSLLSVSEKSEPQGETLKVSVGRYDVEVVPREVSLQGTRELVAMTSWW